EGDEERCPEQFPAAPRGVPPLDVRGGRYGGITPSCASPRLTRTPRPGCLSGTQPTTRNGNKEKTQWLKSPLSKLLPKRSSLRTPNRKPKRRRLGCRTTTRWSRHTRRPRTNSPRRKPG